MTQQKIKEIIQDNINRIGKSIEQHRTLVYNESIEQFCIRINLFSGVNLSTNELKLIEEGNGHHLSLEKILVIWTYLQKIDKIMLACEEKTLLFLASQKIYPDNIETCMIEQNKNPHSK